MTEDSLVHELRQREMWLRASNELTGALLSGQPAIEALKLVARRAAEVSGAPFVAVALPDPEPSSELLVFEVVDNPVAANLIGQRMTITNSLAGKVFTTGEPAVIGDIWEAATESAVDWPDGHVPAQLKRLESTVMVPLSAGTAVLGVLMICRGRGQAPFQDNDLQMVGSFAAHAALAIEFTRAQEDRRRLAVFEERDRIARDLHDKVIQRLFTIGLGLQSLTRLVAKPEVGRRVAAFADELDHTIRDIRHTIFARQETPRR